jgi:predicted AlkP superfamily pyrophosphatase or phosphodiesterase
MGAPSAWVWTWVLTILGCAAGTAGPAPGAAFVPPASATAASTPAGPIRHVVLVTIDGLVPDAYLQADAHHLQIPTLRRIMREGATSAGALSVFPSVTYPAHTSMVTGVWPTRHGIYTNRAHDPTDANQDGWRWYAEDLRAAPLWRLTEQAHYPTALIHWPVTVGAHVTFLVPEFWRAKNDEDQKLLRALATPGLLESVGRRHPRFWSQFTPGELKDEPLADVACDLLRATPRPVLTLLHLAEVDGAQHRHGLWSPAALAAIENADHQLARLLEAIAAAGATSDTALVVASDHGFADVAHLLRPGVLLRQQSLVRLDQQGRIADWRAAVNTSGGSAYVYLNDPADASTAALVRRILQERAAQIDGGIARVIDADQIRALGGDPGAFLAIEAQPGWSLGGGYAGDLEGTPPYAATHGYDPARPEMRASLLVLAPGVPPGPIRDARLIDIAPTIAAWLGLSLGAVDGKMLTFGAP